VNVLSSGQDCKCGIGTGPGSHGDSTLPTQPGLDHTLYFVYGNISGRKLKTKLRHFSEFKTVHFLLI